MYIIEIIPLKLSILSKKLKYNEKYNKNKLDKMGSIISSKVRNDGKIVFEICVDNDEAMQLKGKVDNVFLIPLNRNSEKVNIAQRGTNEATTYFLVPKKARETLKKSKEALFQTIETPATTLYVYAVRKTF